MFWIEKKYSKIIHNKKIIEIIKKDLDTYFYALGSSILLLSKQGKLIEDGSIIALGIAIWSLLESVISRRQNRDIIDDKKELMEKLGETREEQEEIKQNLMEILVDLKNVQDDNRKYQEMILRERKEINRLINKLKSDSSGTTESDKSLCDGYIAISWRRRVPHGKGAKR